MCCCEVNTDVLLANLFAKKKNGDGVTLNVLKDYLNFLSQWIPIYVTSNLCKEEIIICAEHYKELYELRDENGEIKIFPGKTSPKLSYFNNCYNKSIGEYIERLTDLFLNNANTSGFDTKRMGCQPTSFWVE